MVCGLDLTGSSIRVFLASLLAENFGAVMTGLEILKRDMDRLREAIRLDWQESDAKLLTTTERRHLKEPIVALMVELKLLFEQL